MGKIVHVKQGKHMYPVNPQKIDYNLMLEYESERLKAKMERNEEITPAETLHLQELINKAAEKTQVDQSAKL
jgi:hypothetical protein